MAYNCNERFAELGMPPPEQACLEPPEVPPSRRWFREKLFNPSVLVDNWYEDRRAYIRLCPKTTGVSIMKTDYTPKCLPAKHDSFPPKASQREIERQGEGGNIILNTEDMCEYLQNYTTTYDLMHNWEVRRAGCKPKPWRKWRLTKDATWFPDRDNATSVGNLTQFSFRKAPQVPLLPRDWDAYANNPTTNQHDFPAPRYPEQYVHCRRTAPRAIRRENEELIFVRDPRSECNKIACKMGTCRCGCICHVVEDACTPWNKKKPLPPLLNAPRFPRMMPARMLLEHPGKQTLYSTDSPHPYLVLKKKPHVSDFYSCNDPSCPIKGRPETNPFRKPDVCTDYAGEVRRE